MKRDDETTLEYIQRLIREGEGAGTTYTGASTRPGDPTAEILAILEKGQGLTPDQPDIVEQDSLLPPQTITQTVGAPPVDRASIENQISSNRGLLEPQYDETMVMEPKYDLLSGPITARVPTVDATSKQQPADSLLTPRTPDLKTEAQESEGLTGWPWNTAWFEGLRDIGVKIGGHQAQVAEARQLGSTALVEKVSDLVTETSPEREKRLAQEKSDIAGNLREGYISGDITEETMADSELGIIDRITRMVKGDPEPKTIDQEWNPNGDGKLARLLGKMKVASKVIKEAPVSDSVSVTIERAKKNVGSGETATTTSDKPTFFGHSSKEDFLRAAGILGGDKRSLDFTERMDKIDSDSRMFDMIAMLGGAGDSRVGSNFRNKSYQRLKLEFDMDQNEWDRNFKIMAHPWVTYYWHDPKAGIPPKSVPQGMGVGPGWQRQPTTRDKGTTRTQNYDALLAEYDGSEASEDLIALRYVNEFMPSGGYLTKEEQTATGYSFLDAAIPLPNDGKRWTPKEKSQVRNAISNGNRAAVQKMIDEKNYIPVSLRQAIDDFFEAGVDKSRVDKPRASGYIPNQPSLLGT